MSEKDLRTKKRGKAANPVMPSSQQFHVSRNPQTKWRQRSRDFCRCRPKVHKNMVGGQEIK